MKSIIIDAGHGGQDSGAIGFGTQEKEWALAISQYQFKRLKELGVTVAMTRNSDITLPPTTRIAKVKNKYDLCISNHWNAFNGKARGIETIHSIHAKPTFAEDLAQRLVKATGLPFRRVFTREMGKGKDYYFMHRLTGRTETVIIEYGFIDEQQDNTFYQKNAHVQAAAEAVIEGVCKKVGVPYRAPNSDRTNKVKNTEKKIVNKKKTTKGKRVESIYDGELRFYTKPSWKDADVFGHLKKGQGFPTILEKVQVGKAEQYKVQNSKGQTFYLTASRKYVKLV